MRDARNAIHVALTAILFGIGVVLAIPAPTFPNSLSYRVMDAIMPEYWWAVVFTFAGLIGMAGMFLKRWWRVATVIVLSSMHGILAACFLAANPVGTGSWTYAVIACLGYYLAWRRVHDVS